MRSTSGRSCVRHSPPVAHVVEVTLTMATGPFSFAVQLASARDTGQDRAAVCLRPRALLIALADGSGGTSHGTAAAEAFVDAVRSCSEVPADWDADRARPPQSCCR